MTLSPSAVAYPVMLQMFAALEGVLAKGAEYARARDIDEQVLLNWRLAPDMFPMVRQVQIACDITSRGFARLAGAALPSAPDTERSFAELRARVEGAKKFMLELDRSAMDADLNSEVTFPVGGDTMTLKRRDYLLNFILPNLYFHVTAAYANLRACGVPLGKRDFMAAP